MLIAPVRLSGSVVGLVVGVGGEVGDRRGEVEARVVLGRQVELVSLEGLRAVQVSPYGPSGFAVKFNVACFRTGWLFRPKKVFPAS